MCSVQHTSYLHSGTTVARNAADVRLVRALTLHAGSSVFSGPSEFRYVRIPLRIVPVLYFPFCSRCFSIFCHRASFLFETFLSINEENPVTGSRLKAILTYQVIEFMFVSFKTVPPASSPTQ